MPGNATPSAVDVPTLIVHGDRDPVYPIEHAYAMQKVIRGADLLVLEDVAHELPEDVWPEFINRLVRHTAVAPTSRSWQPR
jgi:pimeloyl-ACP methyl ester carboxylesterase